MKVVNVQNAMDGFEKKTLKTSRGFTYTYYVSPTADDHDSSLPALLFSHGWPDHAAMWSGIATQLRKLPFRQVIPDLLGYDETSKPTDVKAYKYDGMTQDLIDILDAEGIKTAISIGHDWGAVVAARVYNYYPDRVVGVILLNVPYLPPAREKFDLQAVNDATKQAFGYPIYEYWNLFTHPEGPRILKEGVERLYSALHAAGPTAMRDFFCVPQAFEKYLESNTPDVEVRAYAQDPNMKKAFVDRMTRDGFEGPQNYYVSFKDNFQLECDSQLPQENLVIKVPLLYVGCTEDSVCRPEGMIPAKQAGLLPDVEDSAMVEAGHWGVYEKPDEIADYMSQWLTKRFVGKK